MFAATDALGAARLDISGMTAALHLAAARATLEVFAPGGQLLLVASANRLEPPGVRGVWTTVTSPKRWALVAVGTVQPGAALPTITFTHRRRQVRGWLTRLGPFWLAEAAGRRLSLEVDDGRVATAAKSRRLPGPVSLRRTTSRLHSPLCPVQETS
ncbi:MAG TPA: hypothetical protein VKJ07_00215 [Mycobacteriales bacterium]|nr:hypothetical protein [Mycobacteriales bacterium]